MAHYAVLDEDNVVLEVLTGMDEDDTDNLPEGYEDWESWYSSLRDGKTVVRTSYNTRDGVHYQPDSDEPSETQEKALRGNYCGQDWVYLPDDDIFLPPKRYHYFVADLDNYAWKPPVDKPNDTDNFYWDDNTYQQDNTTGWLIVPDPE